MIRTIAPNLTRSSFNRCSACAVRSQDIADYLGLTIETVSRTLTRFEREKLLIIIAGGIRLLDPTRAEAIAAA